MAPLQIRDDRGRLLRFLAPPERIVSLVPSDTYTLARLGGEARLVGRTEYCVEPPSVASVPTVGGTKNPDVDRIVALAPDVVLMNQEENRKADVEAMEAAGLRVFVTFPKRVEDGAAQVAKLARLLGEPTALVKGLVRFAYQALRDAEAARRDRPPMRVFVPIWMDPLMTVHGDTFISDQLDLLGAVNVFSDRRRRYPLAADLGRAPEDASARTADRDTRYPRVTLDEVRDRAPELVLLPDEPHAFGEADAEVFRSLAIPAASSGAIVFCSGRDLMWPGLRAIEGIARLGELIRRR
jgi:ABC-type Fe3+-hydroxamate transport system substrate-binding protein